jgi:hypothetical protein
MRKQSPAVPIFGRLAQLVRAPRLHRGGWGIVTLAVYHGTVARLVRRHPHKVIHSGSNPLGTSIGPWCNGSHS